MYEAAIITSEKPELLKKLRDGSQLVYTFNIGIGIAIGIGIDAYDAFSIPIPIAIPISKCKLTNEGCPNPCLKSDINHSERRSVLRR